jgi:hypothetical protein
MTTAALTALAPVIICLNAMRQGHALRDAATSMGTVGWGPTVGITRLIKMNNTNSRD